MPTLASGQVAFTDLECLPYGDARVSNFFKFFFVINIVFYCVWLCACKCWCERSQRHQISQISRVGAIGRCEPGHWLQVLGTGYWEWSSGPL